MMSIILETLASAIFLAFLFAVALSNRKPRKRSVYVTTVSYRIGLPTREGMRSDRIKSAAKKERDEMLAVRGGK